MSQTNGKRHTTTYYNHDKVIEMYVKYRPAYTQEIFDIIIDYCTTNGVDLDFAVDVCCGSGQSSVPLARHFKKVLGVDVSETQIAAAPKDVPNLELRLAYGENLDFVKPGSVSLVTVGTGFHWLNTNKFLSEVARILKPKGALVIYSYDDCIFEDTQVNNLFLHYRDVVLANHWHKEYKMVEERYSNVPCPFPKAWISKTITMDITWTVDDFVGYMGSLSPFNQYQLDHPETDILEDCKQRLQEICDSQLIKEIKVTFPVHMIMTQKAN